MNGIPGISLADVVPVLMYHSVSDSPSPYARDFAVPPALFRAQLAAMRELGRTAMTFSALVNALVSNNPLPPHPVVLTFDDGYGDFWAEAMPLLQLYDFTATVFVTTGWVCDAKDRSAQPPPDTMLSWAQISELADIGIEIGSHSHSHRQLDQLMDDELRAELVGSKERLRERLGAEVRTMAYPYGYSSARIRRAVREVGYCGAAAVDNRLCVGTVDRFAVPRLTIRRSIGPESFRRLLCGADTMRVYWKDRTLTAGWASVRRARRSLRYLRRGPRIKSGSPHERGRSRPEARNAPDEAEKEQFVLPRSYRSPTAGNPGERFGAGPPLPVGRFEAYRPAELRCATLRSIARPEWRY